MRPFISVLMPVFNGEQFLNEAINSILKQTYKNFEFIIINNGSEDNTEQIIKSYSDKRIKYYYKKNTGLVDALNFGVELCTGEWIARFDSDDVAYQNRLEIQIKHIDTETVLIGSGVDTIDENGVVISKLNQMPLHHNSIIDNILNGRASIIHPTVLIRKEMLVSVEGYNKLFEYAEDINLWLCISKTGKIKNIATSLIKLRKHNNNMSILNLQEQTLSAMVSRCLYLNNINAQTITSSEFELIKINASKFVRKYKVIERRQNWNYISKILKSNLSIQNIIKILIDKKLYSSLFSKYYWRRALSDLQKITNKN